jgi:hypothetical protein
VDFLCVCVFQIESCVLCFSIAIAFFIALMMICLFLSF